MARIKQPELKVTVHNPNTPEEMEQIQILWCQWEAAATGRNPGDVAREKLIKYGHMKPEENRA